MLKLSNAAGEVNELLKHFWGSHPPVRRKVPDVMRQICTTLAWLRACS